MIGERFRGLSVSQLPPYCSSGPDELLAKVSEAPWGEYGVSS